MLSNSNITKVESSSKQAKCSPKKFKRFTLSSTFSYVT